MGASGLVVLLQETIALKLWSRGLLISLPNQFDILWATFSHTCRERERLSWTQTGHIKTGAAHLSVTSSPPSQGREDE